MKINRRDRLSYKQAMITVLTVFLMGLAISLYQITNDLEKVKKQADETVTQVLSLLKASASQAAFSLDNHLAEQVVDGLFEFAPIFQAEIRDDFGGRLAYSERSQSKGEMKFVADFLVGKFKTYRTPLIWEESNQAVGEMIVVVDTYLVASSFLERAKLILISGVVRNLVLALILTTLFYFTLTKPLMKTVQSLAGIKTGDPVQSKIEMPAGHEKDEIGLIVQTGNRVIEDYQQYLYQRKQAEKELRYLRNLLGSTVNSMPSILVGVSQDGSVIQWNQAAEQHTGVTSEDALGKAVDQIFPLLGGEMEQVRSVIKEHQLSREKRLSVDQGESNQVYDLTVYPLVTDEVTGAVMRLDNVTEKVKIEEMMIQSEKMLSVGGLAAGMAHEINNPLAGILQNVQVIQNRLKPSLEKNREIARKHAISLDEMNGYLQERKIFDMLELVLESGKRASKIVDNMLSFSRKGGSRRESNNIAELMDKTLELAANDYDLRKNYDFKQIQIVREYDQDLPELVCERSQIQQVLLNLLKNGAEAMADIHQTAADSRFILRIKREVKGIRIEVEDNGPGMDEEVQKRVFEPFYTNKPVGVGTGLGLSVSYFIVVENHNGEMMVESRQGHGTTFIIRLPYSSKLANSVQPELAGPSEI